MSEEKAVLPRDVPVTPAYRDPDDSQRLWALGVCQGEPVFLTCFVGNQEWHVNWSGPDGYREFGVTPERVALWTRMLHENGHV